MMRAWTADVTAAGGHDLHIGAHWVHVGACESIVRVTAAARGFDALIRCEAQACAFFCKELHVYIFILQTPRSSDNRRR
jgi:hypothetical protein